jgi:hypothetical protein
MKYQGCQIAYFQTKNTDLGEFLQWKMLVYYMAIRPIVRLFGIVFGHLVYLMAIWYIFPFLVCYTKKNLATLIF